MIFIPYSDENKVIEKIHSVRNDDYALLRITPTMVQKNDTDCNGIFRSMLSKMKIVDYTKLSHGKENGVKLEATLILSGNSELVPMNFYIVNGQRGDRRMTIGNIARRAREGQICVGDLLYFSTYEDTNNNTHVFIVNLTRNFPSTEELASIIGIDMTNKLFRELAPTLKNILKKDVWVPNSKGSGTEAAKDVGETLEALLKVDTNNRPDADINGLIELKGKGSSGTKDTLFTLRPCFDGTFISTVETNDAHRVKVFPFYYGYDSERHKNCKDLYITIGPKDAPQNQHGFYLDVDEKNCIVKMMGPNLVTRKSEMVAFWTFDSLEKALAEKHPATLWITADKDIKNDTTFYNFNKIEFSRAPSFTAFITLVKSGAITYDWRGHTSIESKYSGINKGNAWRIKPREKHNLFGSLEVIDLS